MTIARMVHGWVRAQDENLQSQTGVERTFGNVGARYMNELCFRGIDPRVRLVSERRWRNKIGSVGRTNHRDTEGTEKTRFHSSLCSLCLCGECFFPFSDRAGKRPAGRSTVAPG